MGLHFHPTQLNTLHRRIISSCFHVIVNKGNRKARLPKYSLHISVNKHLARRVQYMYRVVQNSKLPTNDTESNLSVNEAQEYRNFVLNDLVRDVISRCV